jgi:LacI family transcriptional regulator
MHAFADAGLDVPADIAVVGFDDIEAAGLVRPTLTTVAQDSPALAAAAVTALLDFVDNAPGDEPAPAPEGTILTPTRLVIRQSCGGGR